MSCTFLDYIWGGLVAASLSSMLMLSVFWLASKLLLERVSARRLKWLFHANYSLIALVTSASFALILLFSRDLASGCFAKFAEGNGGLNLTRVIAGVWLTGVLAMITWDLIKVWRAYGQISKFRPYTSANLEAWSRKMGLQRRVELLISPEPRSPYVFGLLNYRIVLPEGFLFRESLGPVLAHELAHARDFDALWMMPERLCRRILFFNPLVYLLNSAYQLLIERAADEIAIAKGEVSPRRLAEALVSVAEEMRYEPSALKLGVGRCYRDLRIRIEALGRKRKSQDWLAVALAAVLLVSAGAAWPQVEEKRFFSGQPMCRQVEDEKVIESLFRIKTESNSCEERNHE